MSKQGFAQCRALFVLLTLCIGLVFASCGSATSNGSSSAGSNTTYPGSTTTVHARPHLPAPGTFLPEPIPTKLGGPVVVGTDGNFWSADSNVDRVTPSGTLTEFSPPSLSQLNTIARGPDGSVWVAAYANAQQANVIYKVTMSGQFTTFPAPSPAPLGMVVPMVGLTVGPDGNLWFTVLTTIGEMNPKDGHIINQWSVPNPDNPDGAPLGPAMGTRAIIAGPDGNLWFIAVDPANAYIGRVTPTGDIHLYQVEQGMSPTSLTAGPDGNIWVTLQTGTTQVEKIGRIAPSGQITEFPMPVSQTGVDSIVAGPDGNLWFSETQTRAIGCISPQGVMTSYPLPDAYQGALGRLVVGPDKNIWFESYSGLGWITA